MMTVPPCLYATRHRWVRRWIDLSEGFVEVQRCDCCGYYRERRDRWQPWVYVAPSDRAFKRVLTPRE